MNNLNRIKSWYRLLEQKAIGNTLAHRIIEELGDPVDYIGIKNDIWDTVDYIKAETKAILQKDIDPPLWDKIVQYIETSPSFKFISYIEDDYPENLKSIFQPPLFITALGNSSLLNRDEIISIVGTRKCTQYGRYITEKVVSSLMSANYIVCSGLALGIDAIAHRKTLELNGITIAVLACGLDTIYPPQNRDIFHKILEKGAIICENLPCLPFEKFHFPQRNRIISALSKAVVVIEGNNTSGAMITAKFALEQGKEIYALPGDILRPEAQGPNSLISRGAKMILTPDDILSDLNIDYVGKKMEKKLDLSDEETKLYEIIKVYTPDIHLDELVLETGMSIGEISALLFIMEMKDAIRQTDNCRYAIS